MTTDLDTVACELCGATTDATGTRLCNPCWEVNRNFTDEHHLGLSKLACAVADSWLMEKAHPYNSTAWLYGDPRGKGLTAASGSHLGETLDILESATRNSPLRKVKP